jgi:hypothetical protein
VVFLSRGDIAGDLRLGGGAWQTMVGGGKARSFVVCLASLVWAPVAGPVTGAGRGRARLTRDRAGLRVDVGREAFALDPRLDPAG